MTIEEVKKRVENPDEFTTKEKDLTGSELYALAAQFLFPSLDDTRTTEDKTLQLGTLLNYINTLGKLHTLSMYKDFLNTIESNYKK